MFLVDRKEEPTKITLHVGTNDIYEQNWYNTKSKEDYKTCEDWITALHRCYI